ncbi:MAG TPA: T9SS type A sorting domain-containing protein [Flavipsychrobacter sp.]|nr:T9SS type A sorting domain-containing protein [Flavipsychrobacter sp.]
MKHPILLLSFVVLPFTSFGQDYNPFTPGTDRFFINAGGYLRGMRIDSVTTIGPAQVYHPFRSPRNYYQTLNNDGGSWLGKHVTRLPGDTFYFDNLWNDTVVIRSQALLNDTWTMYDDATSIYYLATLTSIDTMTVLGSLDSIKTITINAFDASQPLTSDPLDNKQIILSKNHGLVQTMDLFTFPAHAPGQPYQDSIDRLLDINPPTNTSKYIFSLIEFTVPTQIEIYDYEIGDAFGKKGWEVGFFDKEWIDTVMSKNIVSSNQIEYTIRTNKKLINQYGWNYSSIISTYTATNAPAFAMYKMPEESNQGYVYYYYPLDAARCHLSAKYVLKDNFIFFPTYGNCGFWYHYKKGLGLIDYAECFSLDVGDSQADWMVYSRKNGQPCGYLADPVNLERLESTTYKFDVYPNPSNQTLFIKNPNQNQLYLSLSNIYGQQVANIQGKNETITISTANLVPGIYNLRTTNTEGQSTNTSILIQH